jgi:hypothetical protein
MNAATRTTASRKAMRVATVFTGAAAAAVGFAPTALAAPVHAAAQGHPAQANGRAQEMRPDANSIQSRGCTTNTWLHIEYSEFLRSDLCKQFGFAGSMKPAGGTLAMTAQCGGNNVGNIYYSSHTSLPYYQGAKYRSFSPFKVVSKVSIFYWSGTEKCAWPR